MCNHLCGRLWGEPIILSLLLWFMKCPLGGATLDAHISAAFTGRLWRFIVYTWKRTPDSCMIVEWFIHWTTTPTKPTYHALHHKSMSTNYIRSKDNIFYYIAKPIITLVSGDGVDASVCQFSFRKVMNEELFIVEGWKPGTFDEKSKWRP